MTNTAFDCPRCGVPLAMSERQGIEIDYCPQCRGVWLDRGELDKIIERNPTDALPTAAQATPFAWMRPEAPQRQEAPPTGYAGSGHHRSAPGSGHGGRRKSWLREIFD